MDINIHGVSLHYEMYGDKGPKVLLMHGWGCSTKHFEPIVKAMEQEYRLCVIDFPAHGLSSRPPEPWGVSEFTECVKAFVEAVDFAPCDVIAHSFGGRVSIMLAAQYPHLVNRMVLTGCAGLRGEKTPEQQKREAAFKKKKAALTALSNLPLMNKVCQGLLHALQQKYGSADYNALDDEMKKTFVKVISQDLREYLPAIKASTLLVFGENDTATPLWMGKTLEKEISDAALIVFEKDDHYAYLHQWPRFVAIVKAFFK